PAIECEALAKSTTATQPIAGKRAPTVLCLLRDSAAPRRRVISYALDVNSLLSLTKIHPRRTFLAGFALSSV
ncbi:hypothetical protein K5D69_15165, partial [Pseudomonas cichorii]|uniref:hypothetical protein n=1 Tax=Pseudomonas cichorii TaxID=36746 RepID=UPI001C89C2AE